MYSLVTEIMYVEAVAAFLTSKAGKLSYDITVTYKPNV
jgi:hypothetical protein